jgi:hypothetical protein
MNPVHIDIHTKDSSILKEYITWHSDIIQAMLPPSWETIVHSLPGFWSDTSRSGTIVLE